MRSNSAFKKTVVIAKQILKFDLEVGSAWFLENLEGGHLLQSEFMSRTSNIE